MNVSRLRALRGPNLWSRRTALEAVVSCDPQEYDIANLPGFEDRLRARFPAIGVLQPAGHDRAVPLACVLGATTLALQLQAGCAATFSRCVPTIETGMYQVVVEYGEEAVGRRAFALACRLIAAALENTPFDLAAALSELAEIDESERLGPSTGAIVAAAVARGIPFRRLTSGSLVQFGWGRRQRRIQAAETSHTSAIAESIAQDKEMTKRLLHAAGVPVPLGRPVKDADDAWAAAQEIGVPIVLKPRDGNQGKGVAVNISSREQICEAYRVAASHGHDIIVERYFPGHDFRLLVVGDVVVAAARRDPPSVNGDGKRSIRELVDDVNQDPRRGEGHATSLTKIRLDEIALATLAKHGYTPESVPAPGARVVLRDNANLSTGGAATDVTEDVHPAFAARAVAAAKAVGLDVCGVDVVADTVIRPLEDQSGGIVEVNAAPGLRMHLSPSFGKGRAVGEAIISTLFEPGDDGRIPVAAVAGTNGKTTTVRLIAHMLGAGGRTVGMTNSDGIYIGNRRIDTGDCSGPRSARNVLMHPDVDAAAFETARGGILREGLGFDRCDVAVVTNIGAGDHLGLNYISTAEDLAMVKRVIVENVGPNGAAVLNAMDSLVVPMAASCRAAVIFFAHDRHHRVVAAHHAQGMKVVYRDGNDIVAAHQDNCVRLPLAHIPLTDNGRLRFQVENVMAAVGAAWALRLPWDSVRERLSNFVSNAGTAPGRFNRFRLRGAEIIIDYGHNPDAMRALVSAIEALPAGRRTVVVSGPGDRRDQDLSRQTEILGDAFDRVVLYEGQCQRGRQDGEVMALLKQGLASAKRTRDIVEISGEFPAIDAGLNGLEAGDLCLILIDQVDAALAYIERLVQESNTAVT
ncbi:cyanophycin synthetase [Pusillimonas sp.]|uniref:cyanophycin synthetase n=1 Tax=Pusillimonas sp. TaxID=3040095 RepID=UPI0037C8307E